VIPEHSESPESHQIIVGNKQFKRLAVRFQKPSTDPEGMTLPTQLV
jgi:hypothetical protein